MPVPALQMRPPPVMKIVLSARLEACHLPHHYSKNANVVLLYYMPVGFCVARAAENMRGMAKYFFFLQIEEDIFN